MKSNHTKSPKTPKSRQNAPEIFCKAYVLILCTVYLLAIPAGGYIAISEWKYHIFLLLHMAFLLLTAEQKLVSGQTFLQKPRAPDAFSLSVLAYFLFTCVSGMASDYPGVFFGNARHDGILTIGLYAASALLLAKNLPARDTRNPCDRTLFAAGASVTLFCLLGFVQLTGANPFGLYPDGLNFYDAGIYYMGQYWATVGNTNLCAALLSAAAGAFAAVSVHAGKKSDWLSLVPLALSVFSIVELDSEAGMAALLAGLILLPPFIVTDGKHLANLLFTYSTIFLSLAAAFAISFFDGGAAFGWNARASVLCAAAALSGLCGLFLRKSRKLRRVPADLLRKTLAGFSAAAAGAGICVLYFYNGLPDGFLQQAHELLHGHWDDDYGSSRLFIWRQVWALVRESPLLGGGPDTLGLRGLEGFAQYVETTETVVEDAIDAAHNEYLNILVNQGALALCAYLSALCVSLFRWWKRVDSKAVSIAGSAALFYLAQAFFGMSSCATTPYLWMALAVINKKFERNEQHETVAKTNRIESGTSPDVRASPNHRTGRRNRA